MWGALPLPHPTDAGRRSPEKPGPRPGDGETRRGGAQGAPGGVRGCERARAAPRTFPPPTQPKPGARTPRRAHVVQPRLLERAARRLGAALEGRRTRVCVLPSLLHFFSSASRLLGVGAGIKQVQGPLGCLPHSLVLLDTLFTCP